MTADVGDEISVGWGCVHAADSTRDMAKSTILYDPDPMVPMVAFQNLIKNPGCTCIDGSPGCELFKTNPVPERAITTSNWFEYEVTILEGYRVLTHTPQNERSKPSPIDAPIITKSVTKAHRAPILGHTARYP